METESYVPLSVRYGGRRKKIGWWLKGRRQAVALWLAPWLTPSSYHPPEPEEWPEGTGPAGF
jgi:hypothetical protein